MSPASKKKEREKNDFQKQYQNELVVNVFEPTRKCSWCWYDDDEDAEESALKILKSRICLVTCVGDRQKLSLLLCDLINEATELQEINDNSFFSSEMREICILTHRTCWHIPKYKLKTHLILIHFSTRTTTVHAVFLSSRSLQFMRTECLIVWVFIKRSHYDWKLNFGHSLSSEHWIHMRMISLAGILFFFENTYHHQNRSRSHCIVNWCSLWMH